MTMKERVRDIEQGKLIKTDLHMCNIIRTIMNTALFYYLFFFIFISTLLWKRIEGILRHDLTTG